MVFIFYPACYLTDRNNHTSLHYVLDLQGKKKINYSQKIHIYDWRIQARSMVLGVSQDVSKTPDNVLSHIL